MPTPTKGPRLGGSPAHQRLILSNLATSLFEHGRITTTEAKARRLRPFAERLITKAKRDDLHARRQVLTVIRDKGVVHELFTAIGPRYVTRPGGYTRITKLGPRKGDNAPMAMIELVEERQFATQAPVAASAAPAAPPVEQPAASAAADDTPVVAADDTPVVAADDTPVAAADDTPVVAADDTPVAAEDVSVVADDTTVPTPDEDATAAADDTESPVDGDTREEEVQTVAGDGGSPAAAAEGTAAQGTEGENTDRV